MSRIEELKAKRRATPNGPELLRLTAEIEAEYEREIARKDAIANSLRDQISHDAVLHKAEIVCKDAALKAAQIALELDESDCAYASAASDALDLINAALSPAEKVEDKSNG